MTTFQNFSAKVLEEIDKRKIDQVPRWHFVVKNMLFWGGFGIALILGSFSFAVVFFALFSADFDLFTHLPFSRLSFFLQSLPFFWLGFLGIFLGLSILFFRITKKGYQIELSKLFGLLLGLSIVFGGILNLFGGGELFERIFTTPFQGIYHPVEERRMERWAKPEDGFLGGEIQERGENTLFLIDPNGKEWEVDITRADFFPDKSVLDQKMVRIIGKVQEPGKFWGEKVLPWGRPGEGRIPLPFPMRGMEKPPHDGQGKSL